MYLVCLLLMPSWLSHLDTRNKHISAYGLMNSEYVHMCVLLRVNSC